MTAIVIRIHPTSSVDGSTFQNYLKGLQIAATDVSNGPTNGQQIGPKATYFPSSISATTTGVSAGDTTLPLNSTAGIDLGMWAVGSNIPAGAVVTAVSGSSVTLSQQVSGNVSGAISFESSIVQHTETGNLETIVPVSIATAVIIVPPGQQLPYENLSLRVTRTAGGNTEIITIDEVYYNVILDPSSPAPDGFQLLSTTSLYIALPPPPPNANAIYFTLPSKGTPPKFDELVPAIQQALKLDPDSVTTQATGVTGNTLSVASIAGIAVRMTASSGSALAAGTVVLAVNPTTTSVVLSSLATGVTAGANVTFTLGLADLTPAQCQTIAYEMVWGPQLPVPQPAAPPNKKGSHDAQLANLEALYTNPPNSGSTSDQDDQARQQFEGAVESFYATRDATATQLANYVYAAAAAMWCERQSLAATEALLNFSANPGTPSGGLLNDIQVILTGLGPATNFGVPAAYFYALAATMPSQDMAQQRYARATGELLTSVLSDLTTAINAGVITDDESFTGTATSITAAQAARRLCALNVPAASTTPLAPLDTVVSPTVKDAPSGSPLTFASVAGVKIGMSVAGLNIAAGTTVAGVSTANESVTLNPPVPNDVPILGDVPAGTNIVFTPQYSADLQSMINSWLSFPLTPNSAISSVSYQPGDDDSKFWPVAANAKPAAFLNLVLCALTQGSMLPPPFSGSLGDAITTQLLPLTKTVPSATVIALAAVTGQQWTSFFQANPTWLPSSPQSGDINTRITDFIGRVQKFFAVASGGPSGPFVLATSAATAAGDDLLQFPPLRTITAGMSVSGAGVATGTTVKSVAPPAPAATTSVTLTKPVLAANGINANITFSLSVGTSCTSGPSTLPGLATDWLNECLSDYEKAQGAYTLGSGLNLPQLQAAAAIVFPGDFAAQAWIVDALVTLDALYKIVEPVKPPAWVPIADATAYTFSVVEALYARGFTSVAGITELSATDFQQALAGTVAFDLALAIYSALPASAPTPAPVAGFQPVNPDGALTNCIPPHCSSPFGPVAYLSELLQLSEISTCETPVAAPLSLLTNGDMPSEATLPFVSTTGIIAGMLVSGNNNIAAGTAVTSITPTSVTLSPPPTGDIKQATITFTAPSLASALSQRRGAIGDLTASCANLETPLPLIDIGNECLEYMASQVISQATPVSGKLYDTARDAVAGHVLCQDEPCPDDAKPGCHQPARLFAALPEHSTPTVAATADSSAEPPVWKTLKSDFSSCRLPYSQALDVSRSYLRHLGSCRFEEMRAFRKCITEFVLDPGNEPAGFADYQLRRPVRIDIAREYLSITPEEYDLVFGGAPIPSCGGPVDSSGRGNGTTSGTGGGTAGNGAPPAPGPSVVTAQQPQTPWQFYGFAAPGDGNSWINTVVQLPEFLTRTCLSYCEFFELWQSGFVPFRSNDGSANGQFPQCEPCCLDAITLVFPDTQRSEQSLAQLAVFMRLWRKLKESSCLCLSFAELRDVCGVLKLYAGTASNPDELTIPNQDFIRQLAAFQMLREEFRLELYDLRDKPAPGAVDADRTQILALWVGPAAKKWGWAVRELCDKVVLFARRRGRCEHRSGDFAAILVSKLDTISRLVGFDPGSPTDNWHALPTHTLRLAEVLTKITQSRFHIGELLYLFTADDDPGSGEPFPLQPAIEAQELPLGLPDDEAGFSLWRLRQALLEASDEGTGEGWEWPRVAAFLQHELGFAASDVVALAEHVFPHVLERAGHKVDVAAPRFVTSLPAKDTTPAMWTGHAGSPFQYDAFAGQSAGELWVRIPFSDQAVVAQLTNLQALKTEEQLAVQDLYFQPRTMLARFALLFPDFPEAERYLIEEEDGERRWQYFLRHVALCHRRCHIIAAQLSRHVAAATRQECPEDQGTALLILRELLADQNGATGDWQKDDGTRPAVAWTAPNGGAFAALLGLVGTGLVAEYKFNGGAVVWRDVSGALDGFGELRDRDNAPMPTVLPALGATLPSSEAAFLEIRNGFLLRANDGDLVGGAQGFDVTWSGALLVEDEGSYEFWAGAPTPTGEKPNLEAVEDYKWRAVLKRGSRSWVILSHQWPGEEERLVGSRVLRRGAYELTVELVRPDPDFASADRVHRVHGGFEIKYAGDDSCGERIAIPHQRLFSIGNNEVPDSPIATQSPGANAFLATLYTSSLRDIRRTYQRAFKALLFAHRFGLIGRLGAEDASELGFILQNGANFAGASYFRNGGGFKQHLAYFDFNFLPIADDYFPPSADGRAKPLPQRMQAMFDWWERLFDYTAARDDIRRHHDREFWHLFADAEKTKPVDPAPLLAKLGVDPKCRPLGLRYYVAQNAPVYAVTAADLEDERWGIRVWHAERWLSALVHHFTVKDIGTVRPDLWASDNPSADVTGETATGNANLAALVGDGCLENGVPRRYDDLRRLNDGLRLRGRDALVAWLCAMNRVALPWASGQFAKLPRDLSDLLLLDVEAGICERASRIEEAISAVQAFVRRARLHLESGWAVSRAFARLWDSEFATFEVWRACKERLLYKENWIEWSDLRRAQRVEAFRTLEAKLRQSELAIAAPGGGDWWPGGPPRIRHDPNLLQVREPARMQLLPAPHQGIDLLGTPEYAARPSWLGLVPAAASGNNGNGQLPVLMETAIRLGTRFWRIAAAGTPPGAGEFLPHAHVDGTDCVSCCEECGCEHALHLDEYYFWLIPGAVYEPPTTPPAGAFSASGDYQNGFQYDFYDADETHTSTVWQDPTQLPHLLAWPSSPTVRLAWCRFHNGQLGQPRRSAAGVRVDPNSSSDLQFLGRQGDSLTFSVSNPIAVQGHADTSAPGFRYDIALDDAVVLPQVAAQGTPQTFLGALTLPAYPYFLFFEPGAPLYPLSPFSPSLAIAQALRAHCRFEDALAWYREAFDPLRQDCTWIDCRQQDASGAVLRQPAAGACCDAADVSCDQARNRAVLLHYLETLVEWSDALRHRGNSPEAFQQAYALLDVADRILGRPPRPVRLQPPSASPKVAGFTPTFAALNPRLIDLYEVVADRLGLIRTCQSARRLPDRRTDGDRRYFGNDPSREGWRGLTDCCAGEDEWCHRHSPYRFSVLIQKAQDYAARVEQFGNAFQAAVEKGDAELLASLRAGQEREVLSLGLASQEDQWRDADWTIEALEKTKAISQTNLNHYQGLISAGLIDQELAYQDLTIASTVSRGAGEASDAIGSFLSATGNTYVGMLNFYQIPPGSPLAGLFAALSRILMAVADATASTAGLNLTEAGWTRRLQEWNHQVDVLTIEIQQIERQKLAAQRRRGKARKDLNMHRRQIEHAIEVQDFLRDKFTAPELYLYLQKETAALHRRMYELALDAARQAQHAFNLERGHTHCNFLPDCAWDDQHQGLLAGERLGLALRHMEKTYLDENVREHELTKHFSLRLHFPIAFLRLRATGCCEIDIRESMFDLNQPGHFMRRIRNLSVTIPCVTSAFTGVHCRLTLLASMTRVDPRRSAPAHECCCTQPCCDECGEDERLAREYLPCADDPRIVRQYGAREAIATSSGRDDSGMFQLDFNDQRYLPFEYMGAVSRWRIELPPENNYFDMDTLTDFVIRFGYTAREGGELLRQAAFAAARRHLPGDGWRFFELRQDFQEAWQQLRDAAREEGRHARLRLCLERQMFPFIPHDRQITLDGMAILFDAHQDDGDDPDIAGCPCPEPRHCATRRIEIRHCGDEHRDAETVLCRASDEWPDLYCGVFTVEATLGGRRRHAEFEIRFGDGAREIGPVFLLCHYRTEGCAGAGSDPFGVVAARAAQPDQATHRATLASAASITRQSDRHRRGSENR
jgi:hypothetical protein